jgi:hypothetical protein
LRERHARVEHEPGFRPHARGIAVAIPSAGLRCPERIGHHGARKEAAMKRITKKLVLNCEVVRGLAGERLALVAGGWPNPTLNPCDSMGSCPATVPIARCHSIHCTEFC